MNNGLADRGIGQVRYRHQNWGGKGGPMDLRCPDCKSTDLKKVSLAYQEGLYRLDTCTRLTAVLIGSGGPDMVAGRARTKGFRQTELSRILSPPRKWSYLKLVLWSGTFTLGALVAYVNHVMASPPPVSALPVEIYAVVFSAAIVVVGCLFLKHNHGTYSRQYAQWNRSFICLRCGSVIQPF